MDVKSRVHLTGLVISTDGNLAIKVNGEGMDAMKLGNELAQKAISQGANEALTRSEVP
jgi:porphobilinogen deaminase